MDQHELIGLVAPRGYHGGDATKDAWADPRGSWLSLVEASKVWAMYSAAADLTAFDWKLYMDHAHLLFQLQTAK